MPDITNHDQALSLLRDHGVPVAAIREAIDLMVKQEKKINGIKHLRDAARKQVDGRTTLGLKDAKESIEALDPFIPIAESMGWLVSLDGGVTWILSTSKPIVVEARPVELRA